DRAAISGPRGDRARRGAGRGAARPDQAGLGNATAQFGAWAVPGLSVFSTSRNTAWSYGRLMWSTGSFAQKLCTYQLVTPGSMINAEPTGVTTSSFLVSMIV